MIYSSKENILERNSPFRILWLVLLFSIAMGFLESAVVIYLRKIYYPNGFSLPLVAIDKEILLTEILREAATIIMLLTAGIIAGKTKASRFAYFIFCFGVWDIFYYVFLKLILAWPASIMDWDILFLIPVPWFGPVLVPCIISLTMIVLAVYIIVNETNGELISIGKTSWLLLIAGSIAFVWSCIHEYMSYVSSIKAIATNENEITAAIQKFIPSHFDWVSFCIAEIFCLIALFTIPLKKNVT